MLLTITYFIIALLLLITIHEYGHFIVARLCGVKVLRFSFGFGKVLARWHDKRGTEYVWSILPLGGYVKMLDEEEQDVPPSERHLAFNNKPILIRSLIVLAGPAFNFLFAFVALWLVLVIGIYSLAPIIETVVPGSIAAKAGLTAKEEILLINDKPIMSWRDFHYAMVPFLGSHGTIKLIVKSGITGEHKPLTLSLGHWQLDAKQPDLLASLGIKPFIPSIPPIIGTIIPGTPAKAAGLAVNDRIEMMDGKPLNDWLDLVEYIRNNPNKKMTLSILRANQHITLTVIIGSKQDNTKEGFLGLASRSTNWPKQWLRFQRENPLTAVTTAFMQTVQLTAGTFSLVSQFMTGHLAVQNLSGPIGIAQGAGESGRGGIAAYLSFLALVSISLGVLNLLPIPMLDGGHLLFYCIEFIIRRPVSQAFKSVGFYMGLVFLMLIMALALNNDITRLSG